MFVYFEVYHQAQKDSAGQVVTSYLPTALTVCFFCTVSQARTEVNYEAEYINRAPGFLPGCIRYLVHMMATVNTPSLVLYDDDNNSTVVHVSCTY